MCNVQKHLLLFGKRVIVKSVFFFCLILELALWFNLIFFGYLLIKTKKDGRYFKIIGNLFKFFFI